MKSLNTGLSLEESSKILVSEDDYFRRIALGNLGPSMQPVGEHGCRVLKALSSAIDHWREWELHECSKMDPDAHLTDEERH